MKAQLQCEQQTSGRGTFVPLVFAPGEAFQFDWSEDWAVIAGERVKLQAADTVQDGAQCGRGMLHSRCNQLLLL